MAPHRTVLRCLLVLLVVAVAVVTPVQAGKTGYSTGFTLWRGAGGGFADWALSGTALDSDGALRLDPASAATGSDDYAAGGYYGISYYNGGSFFVGEAMSPEMPASFNFSEAIASWNADTPPGTWVETLIRANAGDYWTKWYNLGIWAADEGTIQRHSVRLQGDADGYVAVDTLVLSKKAVVTGFQVRLRLFSEDVAAIPTVRSLSVAYSTPAEKPKELVPGDPANWGTLLGVPECSQMVYEGGNVWCSPTSTSMVLGYWGIDPGECGPRVLAAVAGIYDWIYDGTGNWPFNTAYAASRGLEGYVARFTSLAQAEPWVKAGVPVVFSFAWNKGDLTGAAVPSSDGHLSVLVGFDGSGNPIVNDPAAATDDDVQRTYVRSELESVWLEASGGTVYLIYPVGHPVPQ